MLMFNLNRGKIDCKKLLVTSSLFLGCLGVSEGHAIKGLQEEGIGIARGTVSKLSSFYDNLANQDRGASPFAQRKAPVRQPIPANFGGQPQQTAQESRIVSLLKQMQLPSVEENLGASSATPSIAPTPQSEPVIAATPPKPNEKKRIHSESRKKRTKEDGSKHKHVHKKKHRKTHKEEALVSAAVAAVEPKPVEVSSSVVTEPEPREEAIVPVLAAVAAVETSLLVGDAPLVVPMAPDVAVSCSASTSANSEGAVELETEQQPSHSSGSQDNAHDSEDFAEIIRRGVKGKFSAMSSNGAPSAASSFGVSSASSSAHGVTSAAKLEEYQQAKVQAYGVAWQMVLAEFEKRSPADEGLRAPLAAVSGTRWSD